MKLGNTSQSIVPVPNFFLTRSFRDVDTFNVSNGKRYFRETDLFKMTKDINLSNNPRKNHHKLNDLNKEKYIPIHKRENLSNTMKTFSLTRFDDTQIDKMESNAMANVIRLRPTKFTVSEENVERTQDNFKNYTEYMDKTNVGKISNGDVRDGIKNNIQDLLQKINTNMNMTKYNQTDIKSHYLNLNSISYTPLTQYNQQNLNETTKFKNTLRHKINSMTVVNPMAREKALINLDKLDYNEVDRLPILENFNRTSQTVNSGSILLQTGDSLYPKTNYESLSNNSSINYKDLMYPFKKNYARKKEKENFNKLKKNEEYINIINTDTYNSSKHRHTFCESYNIDQNTATHIKSLNEMKTKTFY